MTVGVAIGISTLAAAGLGNTISDVAGVGLGGVVESMATKMGLPPINLSRCVWWSGMDSRDPLVLS